MKLMPAWKADTLSSLLLFSLLVGGLLSCGEEEGTDEMSPAERKRFNDSLIQENRKLARMEDRAIQDYIERREWDMKKSGSGLRYMTLEEGNGKEAEKGMVAKVNYQVELLSGRVCYSSDSAGAKSFLIGKDDEVTGLHEGVQYMREGGKAVFIMPAHLAHGLLGDTERIPMHATLVYHIELLELRRPVR